MKAIFHHPLPLDEAATSASGIRPVKMLKALEALGYEMTVVAGYGAERKIAIEKINKALSQGVQFDFCYSESSTQPTLLTERHHLPLYPWQDFGLFGTLKKNKIPIGLFYRDIFWLFEDYGKNLHPLKKSAAKIFYRYDLFQYRRLIDCLYLPSLEMAPYIPRRSNFLMRALPPGHSGMPLALTPSARSDAKLHLLYVGGMSSHYQMHEFFNAMPLDNVTCTLCTRESEWYAVKKEYGQNIPYNISIVHESGAALSHLYKNADICLLFVKPQEYWEFAVPFKLFEYLGEGKPIIAAENTLAGHFVQKNKIGWTIPYHPKALQDLLTYLKNNRHAIDLMQENCRQIARNHTWQARARQVASELTGKLS